jgi:hypothetical protein
MTRKDFEKKLTENGYVRRLENQYTKTGENPYHRIIVDLSDPSGVSYYGVSMSYSATRRVVKDYGELDNEEKDKKIPAVKICERELEILMSAYLNNYELIHKLYKIAVKSDLHAERKGRRLLISLEYKGKKYETLFDSDSDYLNIKVTDLETKETSRSKVGLKDLAESCNGIEDLLNKALNIPRVEMELFKQVSQPEEDLDWLSDFWGND